MLTLVGTALYHECLFTGPIALLQHCVSSYQNGLLLLVNFYTHFSESKFSCYSLHMAFFTLTGAVCHLTRYE